jgi:predicted HicB family RNase H-like nuclease
VSNDDRISILIALPEELSCTVVRAAEQEQIGLNDLLHGVLARQFGVDFHPTGRRAKRPTAGKPAVLLRISPHLHRTLKSAAVAAHTNTTDLVLRIWAAEFEPTLAVAAPRRRTPFGGGPTRRHRHQARTSDRHRSRRSNPRRRRGHAR